VQLAYGLRLELVTQPGELILVVEMQPELEVELLTEARLDVEEADASEKGLLFALAERDRPEW